MIPLFPLSFDVQPSLAVPGYKMEILLNSYSSVASQVGCVVVDGGQGSLEDAIDAACADPENYEEGERPPSAAAISAIKNLVVETSEAVAGFTMGDIGSYFGEISITWRKNGRMVRLATFSDGRTPRLDFGTTPVGALGDYNFVSEACSANLIEKLAWLETQEHLAV